MEAHAMNTSRTKLIQNLIVLLSGHQMKYNKNIREEDTTFLSIIPIERLRTYVLVRDLIHKRFPYATISLVTYEEDVVVRLDTLDGNLYFWEF